MKFVEFFRLTTVLREKLRPFLIKYSPKISDNITFKLSSKFLSQRPGVSNFWKILRKLRLTWALNKKIRIKNKNNIFKKWQLIGDISLKTWSVTNNSYVVNEICRIFQANNSSRGEIKAIFS